MLRPGLTLSLFLLLSSCIGLAYAGTVTHSYSIAITVGPIVPQDYYIAWGGSDSNPGTKALPWISPNHIVNCGDTIHVAPAEYTAISQNFDQGHYGVVNNCPASNGKNFAHLHCDGGSLQSCWIGAGMQSFRVDRPHWAVEGFYCALAQGMWSTCFGGSAPYILFVNDYCNLCGAGSGSNDYSAFIGVIMYGGAAGGGQCFSGWSSYKPTPHDTNPGTHIFLGGNFIINNHNPGQNCTDGEGIILDTWNANNYLGQIAIENNIIAGNYSFGFEDFAGNSAPVIYRNNTSYGNGLNPSFQTWSGVAEISLTAGTGNVLIDKSLVQSLVGWPTAAGKPGAATIDVYYATKVTISNSFVFSAHGQTGLNGYTSAGVTMVAPYLPTVTNVTQALPGFTNPHQVTASPNCAAVATTVQCMAQLIADFVPTATGTAGLGYQPPGTCAPNPDWPPWIGPGDVPDGIITKPCGM
jgi:hypothetical protein